MGSSRLPGKVLFDVEGKTVLEHVIERTKRAQNIERVVVAIPDTSTDDVLAEYCATKNISYFRGNETDVLDRYVQAAQELGVTHIARITSDCPLIDPEVIDRVAAEYQVGEYDYLSTGRMETTYPDGLDVEIFSFEALKRAWTDATQPSEREHVTPYIWKHPELFNVGTVEFERDLSELRLTVDEPRDLEFVRAVYSAFHGNDHFLLRDILDLLDEHPEIVAINQGILRNSGYLKSLKEDTLSNS